MGADAFDFADRYQTPVFVVSDLDIGMNDWVIDELTWDDARRPDRGKVLDAEALERAESFARYRDIDGDGVPYRTIPGTHPDKGAYFTRGTSHTDTGGYTEDGAIHAAMLERIKRKIEGAAEHLPQPVITAAGATTGLGIVNFGSTDPAVQEGLELLADAGLALDHMRLRAFPFAQAVRVFAEAHDHIFVIEQNRDAQMRTLLMVEADIPAHKLIAVTNHDGMPLTANFVRDAVLDQLARLPGYAPAARISAE